ncbi:MAG TPA: DPP IV N-terminal domain-containing protein [Verrucomicrobiae bacterium]|nr:DPP IV N-terminal domain-containing protein [Verrucomicrobiae bacterium]
MNHWRHTFILIAICFAFHSPGQSSSTNSSPRVYRDRVEANWFADAAGKTNRFWYRVAIARGEHAFVVVDAQEGTRAPAFDHARVAQELARQAGAGISSNQLPIDALDFLRDGKTMKFRSAGTDWILNLETHALERSVAATSESSLPASRTPRPSVTTGAETSIRFENRLPRELNFFWIDPDGNRQRYGTLRPGETREQHTYAGHVWMATEQNGDILAVFQAEARHGAAVIDGLVPAEPQRSRRSERAGRLSSSGGRSPDQNWEVIVRGHNLFLRDARNGKERQLTHDANPDSSYARNADAERSVELNYESRDPEAPIPEIYWAPDSKHFVAMRLKSGTQRRVYIVESSPEDQLQPKLISYPYLKPGDEVPIRKPHLFDVEQGRRIETSDALFSNPWSISDVRWDRDSRRFTFVYNQRGHQVLRVVAINADDGSSTSIVDEQSKTFINYSGKFFCEFMEESSELIWMSERDGWNHLYLYDARTGRVKNQITRGEWVVRSVDRVDREQRCIWLQVSGIRADEDPYHVHQARVNFDGTGFAVLTESDGTHSVQYSPDRTFAVVTWSRVDQPPVTELRRTRNGKIILKLEETDASELYASGWKPPERFVAKGRDGVTDIFGVIFRPKDFTPSRRYPVVENIYAGPQDSFAPKAFRTNYPHQKLADCGFIVVQLDGMGTANRSKKFHDICFKNLADAGFPDRILWIKAAAAKYSYMDLNRVGIYGTSAGGQNALRGMLDHGDFYKACVSDSACHDNRMDKIWWNEQWMGWPVDESYVKSSNVADAHKLRGKLLLMTGELDRNVDPASTMQVVNALVKADRDFEMLIVPNVGHGAARSPYGGRKLQEFFVRAFHDKEWNNVSAHVENGTN